MKKYIQNIWVRSLACILCACAVLGLGVSVVGIVFFAENREKVAFEYEGREGLLANYGRGAWDYYVHRGGKQAVDELLEDTGVYVRIDSGGILYDNFPSENMRVEWRGEFDSRYAYAWNVDSLTETLLYSASWGSYGPDEYFRETVDILGYVFDVNTGLFYYETEVGFFLVDYLDAVHANGTSYDYRFGIRDGQGYYYNSYYDRELDPLAYETWDYVTIRGRRLTMVPEVTDFTQTVRIVDDSANIEADLWKDDFYFENDRIVYTPRESNTYIVEVSAQDGGYSNECLIKDWNRLVTNLYYCQNAVVPVFWISLLVLVLGMILLLISAPAQKERLRFFHRIPVGIFTILTIATEVVVGGIGIGLIELVLSRDWNISIEQVFIQELNILWVMILIGFIWLANIITRVKTRTFWRYSEVHYILKPIRWCIRVAKEKTASAIRMVKEHTSFTMKALGMLAVLLLFEGIYYLISMNGGGIALVFYFIRMGLIVIVGYLLYQMYILQKGSERIASGDTSEPIDTSRMIWEFKKHGENINRVGEGITRAVEERMKSERFKTELITNVSHDIKTPLTSIINYVDLIKKEQIQDEHLTEYVEVLERQSARLKKLLEDLMEASKASTGNLTVNLEKCDADVLLTQVIGEFEDKLNACGLQPVIHKPEPPVYVLVDGRHTWRVFDNLLNNVCKYAQPGTRVYIDMKQEDDETIITFKNISKSELNISSEQLMERFVRGDSSRNTEGSGLGLSIAQSLVDLMHGTMKLEIDGDLFKVILRFPSAQ